MSYTPGTGSFDPVKPKHFDPDQHCADCEFPLAIDRVVQTICKHVFHEACLVAQLNYSHKSTNTARDLAAASGSKFEEPDVACPCPVCRGELANTRLTPINELPAKHTDEDRDCNICLNPQDPTVIRTFCHLFHSPCFDKQMADAQTAARCPKDGSVLGMVDLMTASDLHQHLGDTTFSTKAYIYRPGMGIPGHTAPSIPNMPYAGDFDWDWETIVLTIAAVVLVASTVAYFANAIFFAGANPILYALGLPVGLILDPIFRDLIIG
jgi:hypothetical protein